jgi:flagellar assembly factor FliW
MNPGSAPDLVVTFTEGLPGFEACRRFVLVESEALRPFRLVQGLDDGGPSFVGIDPRRVEESYDVPLDRGDLARLQAEPGQPLVWFAIITARSDRPATANLRAPIVINPKSMRGIQLLPPDSSYRVDHPLSVE